MTEETILKLAKEAGFEVIAKHKNGSIDWICFTEEIKKFANLVSKAKCKELADKIEQMPFGDTSASFAVWIREQA